MKTEVELEMCENCEGQFPLEEMTATMNDVLLCPECAKACMEATSIFDCIEAVADCEEAGEPYIYLDDLKDLLNQFGIVAGNEIGMMQSELADLRAAIDEATRWIPVSERLPEEGKVVLTKVDNSDIRQVNYQVATYIAEIPLWITAVHAAIGVPECFETVEDYTPTHWRPIDHPKPLEC